jgi:transcriptional regulator with XRE-family HTH domain
VSVATKTKAHRAISEMLDRFDPPLQPLSDEALAALVGVGREAPHDPPNRIRELRDKAGLSQRDLAKRMGLTGPEVHKLENGDRRLTAEHLTKLSGIFGEPPEVIMGWVPVGQGSERERLERIEQRLERIEGLLVELVAQGRRDEAA